MDKVRDDFDVITYETDSILYYNPEDLYDEETKEKIKEACRKGREEGREEGRVEGRREIVKNMLENNLSDELILKYLNIDERLLNEIKKDIE